MSLASKEKGMDQVTLEKASLQIPFDPTSLKSKQMVKEWNFAQGWKRERKPRFMRERNEVFMIFLKSKDVTKRLTIKWSCCILALGSNSVKVARSNPSPWIKTKHIQPRYFLSHEKLTPHIRVAPR